VQYQQGAYTQTVQVGFSSEHFALLGSGTYALDAEEFEIDAELALKSPLAGPGLHVSYPCQIVRVSRE